MPDSPLEPRPRSGLRRWMMNLHLYGGLACSGYLILYGVSSLQFNHAYDFTLGNREVVTWNRAVEIPTEGGDLAVAREVRDRLGLFGFPLPWTMERDAAGDLSFELSRPGKSYLLQTSTSDGSVRVNERRGRVWGVFHALHGGGLVPGSHLMTLWWLFTNLSAAIILFSAASGVYLWVVSKRDRVVGWTSLGAAVLGFFAFVAYLIV